MSDDLKLISNDKYFKTFFGHMHRIFATIAMVDTLLQRIDELKLDDERIDNIAAEIRSLQTELDGFEPQIQTIIAKIEDLNELGISMDFVRELQSRIDTAYTNIDNNATTIEDISESIRSTIEKHETDIADFNEKAEDIKDYTMVTDEDLDTLFTEAESAYAGNEDIDNLFIRLYANENQVASLFSGMRYGWLGQTPIVNMFDGATDYSANAQDVERSFDDMNATNQNVEELFGGEVYANTDIQNMFDGADRTDVVDGDMNTMFMQTYANVNDLFEDYKEPVTDDDVANLFENDKQMTKADVNELFERDNPYNDDDVNHLFD